MNAGSSSLRIDVVELPGTGPPQTVHSQHLAEPADSEAARGALDRILAEYADGVDAITHRLVHGGPDLRAATHGLSDAHSDDTRELVAAALGQGAPLRK